MVGLMVFHNAFGFVIFAIVGMSGLMMLSKIEIGKADVKVAFVIAELRIVRDP